MSAMNETENNRKVLEIKSSRLSMQKVNEPTIFYSTLYFADQCVTSGSLTLKECHTTPYHVKYI